MLRPSALLALPLACALHAAHAGAAADFADITPYRPSVSNPAQLPAPGQLELELGGLHVKDGDNRRDSLPYLLKFGFTEEWGVLLGGEALVSQRDEEGRRRGIGDTTVTLKRAFPMSDATAFGLELGATFATAKEGLGTGSGKTDVTLNGILSQDLGKLHMDANLNATRIGAVDAGTGRVQTGLSAAFSAPFSERWSGVAEWSGTRQSGAPSTAQLLAALVYQPSKQLAIDVGMTRGLNRASPEWSLFSGFVVPLARFR
ncbi:transporter [Oxalobacteraceae bacterium OM1]|nr:transporter [Oxalobacteraceae bacterium OM1]